VLDFQLVLYFINFAVQNVHKAFVYIMDLTSTLNMTTSFYSAFPQTRCAHLDNSSFADSSPAMYSDQLASSCTAFVVFFSSSHLRPNELASQQAVLVHGGAALSSKMTSFHV
jgi:hypothetical protein